MTKPGTITPDPFDYGRPVRPNDKWFIGTQTGDGATERKWFAAPIDPHAYAIWARNPAYRKRRVYLKNWAACLAWVIAAQTTDIR